MDYSPVHMAGGVAARRDFLKRTAGTLGAAIATGALNLPRTVHAAGDDTLKIALIGCGGRGTGAAVNCLTVPDRVKLVAVADAFADRATGALKQLRQQFPGKVDVPPDRVFIGLDAFQKAIDCGVDAVLLVSPPGFRPAHYRAAVEAGKHVFMEKPCCVDAPGFRSLQETNKQADRKNLKVVVGLNMRHEASRIETMQRIHEGALGELKFLRAGCNNAGVWVHRRQPGESEMEYQVRNWYYFVWLSGDHIVEQHVHLLDAANWAKGDQHPIEANGMGGRQVRKGKDTGQIYDHHFVEYTYADGVKLFSQCRHIPNCSSAAFATAQARKAPRTAPNRSAGKTLGPIAERLWKGTNRSTSIGSGQSGTTRRTTKAGMAPRAVSRRSWAAWQPIPGRWCDGMTRFRRARTNFPPS